MILTEKPEHSRAIRIPDITGIKGIKSHEWMAEDLTRSIQAADANFLVALGLFCYTEALGLQLLQFRAKDPNAKYSPRNCFNTFARDYLGYGEVLNNYKDIYGIFRNGLCHEYFIKVEKGGQGGVFHYYSDEDKESLLNQGVDITKGIAFSPDGKSRVFVIEPYLQDFVSALEKLGKEMALEDWNPDIVYI